MREILKQSEANGSLRTVQRMQHKSAHLKSLALMHRPGIEKRDVFARKIWSEK